MTALAQDIAATDDQAEYLLKWLKEYATGRRNAKTREEVMRVMNIRWESLTERGLRVLIQRVRAAGYPVCTSWSGHYYAAAWEDVAEAITMRKAMATELLSECGEYERAWEAEKARTGRQDQLSLI